MKDLKVIIDGVTHQYVKIPISEMACISCSLEKYCTTGCAAPHLCKLFDLSGKCRPTGCYGHFEIIQTEQP